VSGEKRAPGIAAHVAAHLQMIGQLAQDRGAAAKVYRVAERHLQASVTVADDVPVHGAERVARADDLAELFRRVHPIPRARGRVSHGVCFFACVGAKLNPPYRAPEWRE
jgi:hypothetical protein